MNIWKASLSGLFSTILILACGAKAGTTGAPPAGCETDPNACAPGTTCWPKECLCAPGQSPCDLTTCTPHLECLPSSPAHPAHSACSNTVGTPTCSDHQACVELQVNHGGCLTYCDDSKPNHGCADPETCIELKVGQLADAPTIRVCAVVSDAGANGVDAGGGGGDDAQAIGDAHSELPN